MDDLATGVRQAFAARKPRSSRRRAKWSQSSSPNATTHLALAAGLIDPLFPESGITTTDFRDNRFASDMPVARSAKRKPSSSSSSSDAATIPLASPVGITESLLPGAGVNPSQLIRTYSPDIPEAHRKVTKSGLTKVGRSRSSHKRRPGRPEKCRPGHCNRFRYLTGPEQIYHVKPKQSHQASTRAAQIEAHRFQEWQTSKTAKPLAHGSEHEEGWSGLTEALQCGKTQGKEKDALSTLASYTGPECHQ